MVDLSTTSTAAPAERPAQVVFALGVVAMYAWGLAFYGLGFYVLRLHELRGWSLGFLSNITLIFYLVSMVLGFWVSTVIARRGSRIVFLIGAAALGGAVIVLPRAGSVFSIIAVYLLLAVGWSGTNSVPISTTVMAWFPLGQRELSIALIGASFGGIVIIPVLGQLDERYGFTTALTVIGISEIAVVGALALFVIDTPLSEKTVESRPIGTIAWHIVGQSRYWIVSAGLALSICVQGGFLVHQLSILATVASDADATRIVGLATLAALIGRLGPIAIGDRIAPPLVGAAYVIVQAVALFGIAALPHTVFRLSAMSVLFGLGVGVLITMPPLLTRTAFPDEAFTSAYPVINLSFQLFLATGAPLLALGHRYTGGYGPTMWFFATAHLLAALLFLSIHHVSRVHSEGPERG